MKQPEHPVRPAFDQAHDRVAYLQSRLNELHRQQYEAFVKSQDKERDEQRQKRDRAVAEYREAAAKAPHLVKEYRTPVMIRDPQLKNLALRAEHEQRKSATLERSQLQDRLRFLESLDRQQQREQEKTDRQQQKRAQLRDNAQTITADRPSRAFERAAPPQRQAETGRQQAGVARAEQDTPRSRAFEKARQREQARQQTREQSHNRGRERDGR